MGSSPITYIMQENHILAVFPTAISSVNRLIKECNFELNNLLEREWWGKSNGIDPTSPDGFIWHMELIATPRQHFTALKERLEKQKKWFSFKETNDGNIARAKECLITSLVDFNKGGFACCIWHKERTPSLKYYAKNNTVYCFSCQKSGDAIEVVRQLRNCSFKEAISYLSTGVV